MPYTNLTAQTMIYLTPQEQSALGGTHPYGEAWRKPIIGNKLGYKVVNGLRTSVGDNGYLQMDMHKSILGEGELYLKLYPINKNTGEAEDPAIMERIVDDQGKAGWSLRRDLTVKFYAEHERVGFGLHPKTGGWIEKGIQELQRPGGEGQLPPQARR